MRIAFWIIFALAFLTLNICLIIGIVGVGRTPGWPEAVFGIVPTAFVAFICFVLLVAGVGAKAASRFRASILWAAALLWCLALGGIVTLDSTQHYETWMEPVTRTKEVGSPNAYGRRETKTYTEIKDEARGRDYLIGIVFGWILLGFAGVAFVGMAVSLVLSMRAKPATATQMEGNGGNGQPAML